VQVKRLLATPAALPRPSAQASGKQASAEPATAQTEPVSGPAARAAMASADTGEKVLTGTSPEAAALLDEAFGAEPRTSG